MQLCPMLVVIQHTALNMCIFFFRNVALCLQTKTAFAKRHLRSRILLLSHFYFLKQLPHTVPRANRCPLNITIILSRLNLSPWCSNKSKDMSGWKRLSFWWSLWRRDVPKTVVRNRNVTNMHKSRIRLPFSQMFVPKSDEPVCNLWLYVTAAFSS